MKMNKLVLFTAITISISALTGCTQKLKRKTFSEILEGVINLDECHYYVQNGRSYNTWLNDGDSYIMDELKKLDAKKRFTEPEDMDRFVSYDIYRYGYDRSLTSQMRFYENGSIIINEYGSDILDSYSYFTISEESAKAFFTYVEDRYDYAEQVSEEDFLDTKNNKSVYKLLDSLKDEQRIRGRLGNDIFIDSQAQLLGTLENIEYSYFDTVAEYPPQDEMYFLYNTADFISYEAKPWYFGLSRNYRTVYVVNYIKQDRVCRQGMFYYNVYTIDYEAGRTIISEANRILGQY